MLKKIISIVVIIALLIGIGALYIYDEYYTKLSGTSTGFVGRKTSDIIDDDEEEENYSLRVLCIGDSLTLGNEDSSFPTILSNDHKDWKIETCGGESDTSTDAMIRTDAKKVYINHCTIPADKTKIYLKLRNKNDKVIKVLKSDGTNYRTVTIDGIEGRLQYDEDFKQFSFQRFEEGEEVKVKKLTRVKTVYPQLYDNNEVVILFTGNYNQSNENTAAKIIKDEKKIIKKLKAKKYIVVSLTSKRQFEQVDEINVALYDEFGKHFLDFRSYLLKSGLKAAELEATETDETDIANGYIPTSLLKNDLLNGNEYYDELLANQLVKKMKKLKYVTETN